MLGKKNMEDSCLQKCEMHNFSRTLLNFRPSTWAQLLPWVGGLGVPYNPIFWSTDFFELGSLLESMNMSAMVT